METLWQRFVLSDLVFEDEKDISSVTIIRGFN